ncbi:uncharacterized protein CELE_F08F1.3 [Caenorhabditis elegans]|uniref:Uncharacterized protein n=1 Tax=Caenorhabditis elegans TaxID=6239 RepID=O17390_CAEEL|nr:Uncharacterized protein CELE_F08F1.3 [Caenorhabditis elegans]CCD69033.1 Uncharacterized protein CELE_F08F1.3 [Caenorhabditis elegans]|eukprot:NP_509431.2 Uncharacterized protein CELE_F08F1.3 [Caenorhabditis elegans]
MRFVYIFLATMVVVSMTELLPFRPESDEQDGNFTDFPDLSLPQLGIVMSQRSYAYVTAALIMMMFAAVVYCHVVSVRKSRFLEQYQQQGTLPEWSPLLIDRKNICPPPPYEQVV